jgi:osmoprotectant transport system substrate-binding protein
MRPSATMLLRLLALVLAIGLLVAGCGDDDEDGGGAAGGTDTAAAGGEGIAGRFDLSGASVAVGSKDFTEQLILGQVTLQALEAAGADVEDQIGLAGTVAAREALTSGEIDMYWEYTGTGWITHLGETEPVPGAQAQFDAVAERDLSENQIAWLDPAPANNAYQIAVASEVAEELGVATLSDLARLATENPGEATVCVGNEFSTRDDGLPGLQEAYGFEFSEVANVQDGVVYDQIDQSEQCNFGSVFATDGRIQALDLTVLEDDQGFFPFYNPALNVRQEVVDANPAIRDLFAEISPLLTDETLQGLNAAVDVEGEAEDQVAEDFLRENGLLE